MTAERLMLLHHHDDTLVERRGTGPRLDQPVSLCAKEYTFLQSFFSNPQVGLKGEGDNQKNQHGFMKGKSCLSSTIAFD